MKTAKDRLKKFALGGTGGGDEPKPVPTTLSIKDGRKKYLATGVDMWDGAYKTGDYSKKAIQHVALAASRLGLDPYTALAVSMQESKLGNVDDNYGHLLPTTYQEMQSDKNYQKILKANADVDPHALAMAYFLKNKLASGKKFKDEALQIQAYNGLGKISPKTEAEYHKKLGYNPNILYGVDLSKTGPIDMSKNPLYGKTVIDIRDNVLKQNPDLVSFLDNTIKGKEALLPWNTTPTATASANPKAFDGREVTKSASGKWMVTADSGDVFDVDTWNKNKGQFATGGVAGYADLGKAGLDAMMTAINLIDTPSPSAYSKQPIINASSMRNMVNPYASFAMGGDVMEQLQAMADEQGISVEELIAMLQGEGEDGEEGMDNVDFTGDNEDEETIPDDEEVEGEGFATGGVAGGVKINAEGGEVIQTPDGKVGKIQGPKHEQGGVNMNVPPGTKIYSDRVTIDGKSMEERKLKREKALKRLEKTLQKDPNNKLLQATIQRTAQTLQNEEAQDMHLQNSLNQMQQKFAVGGDVGYDPFGDYLSGMYNPPATNYPVPFSRAGMLSTPIDPVITPGKTPGETFLPTIQQPVEKVIETPRIGQMSTIAPIQNPGSGMASTSTDEVDEAGQLGVGDYVGMAGNLFNAIAPIINTKNNMKATKPHLNRYRGFGKDALDDNQAAMDMVARTKANTQKEIDTNTQGAFARNRNSAKGINTLRALDTLTTMGEDKAEIAANAGYASNMANLFGQRGQLSMKRDQMEMAGEAQRDLADEQTIDNYYSNMAQNLTNFGTNVQGIGKAINTSKSNRVDAKLISQLSKYGLGFDDNGNLISTKKGQ